ncbi:MAG: glycoside hydrolase family 28 protein [Lachnospira sp.]|nr:glycoside hydrolase family 28 protein [Lachnospira sp.]
MELKLLWAGMRSAVVRLAGSGLYHARAPYELVLSDGQRIRTDTVVTSVYGLVPGQAYEITAYQGGQEVGSAAFVTERESVTLNVRDFGAFGDGKHDDTAAIQCAIMASRKRSRVLVPKGVFRVSSIFLKSHLHLYLEKGAVIRGIPDRDRCPILPGTIPTTDGKDEKNFGTWEGNPLDMFAGIITGLHVSDVTISGQGTIDGGAGKNTWWKDFRTRNVAWRPRLIFLEDCSRIVLQGITLQNSPSWTLHPYFSRDLQFLDLNIHNPADSPNTDGLDPESCSRISVIGTKISVGDDCIAVKSGKIYQAVKYRTPTCDMRVENCFMQDGHGAVTIGSEIAAGVRNIRVKNCEFSNTDRGLRVKTRRGRGQLSVLTDIRFENIRMDHVKTPLVVNSFYFCDPDGHSDYVGTKRTLPVDERTPSVGKLIFRDIEATGCEYAAAWIAGLPEKKIEELVFDHVSVSYAQNPGSGQPAMMERCGKESAAGLIISGVKNLTLRDVTVNGCKGEPLVVDDVDSVART